MTTRDLRGEAIAAFYARHHHRLLKAVTASVAATSTATIEDACQTAWATLLRRPDVTLDARGLRWLITVAIHEAWRTAHSKDVPIGQFIASCPPEGAAAGLLPEPAGDAADPAERALDTERHREDVSDFRRLKPAERQALALQALGCSYREIAELTDATYTAVNRRLTEGRARLRAYDQARP